MNFFKNILLAVLLLLISSFSLTSPIQAQDQAEYAPQNKVIEAKVTQVVEETTSEYTPGQTNLNQTLQLEIISGDQKGDQIEVEVTRLLTEGQKKYKSGDYLMVNQSQDLEGQNIYYVIDYIRRDALLFLFIIFALLVIAIGRWRGVWSLVGLASSFIIIFTIILPGIQHGFDPVLVSIFGSAIIMLITFYLSHGFNQKTTISIIGTLISLILTGILATVFVSLANLSGFGAEEVAFLQVIKDGTFSVRGLLLAGIIIGTLGILDDITISQASIVKELKLANSRLKDHQLFFKAMNVGQDHIASLVNTLILVYTGSSLPLLLLFMLDPSRSFATVINYEIIAEEIIRTLVGSIGLISAVPITTFIAVKWGFKNVKPSSKPNIASHSHHHH